MKMFLVRDSYNNFLTSLFNSVICVRHAERAQSYIKD